MTRGHDRKVQEFIPNAHVMRRTSSDRLVPWAQSRGIILMKPRIKLLKRSKQFIKIGQIEAIRYLRKLLRVIMITKALQFNKNAIS